jgi:sulfur transfer protein SufE
VLQLEQHLSPTRSNGLAAMMKAIRHFAVSAGTA